MNSLMMQDQLHDLLYVHFPSATVTAAGTTMPFHAAPLHSHLQAG